MLGGSAWAGSVGTMLVNRRADVGSYCMSGDLLSLFDFLEGARGGQIRDVVWLVSNRLRVEGMGVASLLGLEVESHIVLWEPESRYKSLAFFITMLTELAP